MKHRLLELLSAEWRFRLAPEDQEAALEPFAILFGPSVAARELYRFVRDIAYEAIATGTELPEDSDAYRYRTYAKKYAALHASGWGTVVDRAVRMNRLPMST